MKFDNTIQLQEFLQHHNVFPEFVKLEEIFEGGASFNFYIQTKSGNYLLKLMWAAHLDNFKRLKAILEQMGLLYPLPVEDFGDYKMLAVPFIFGHKMHYRDCTPQLMEKLHTAYNHFITGGFAEEYVLPQQTMSALKEEICYWLAKDKTLSVMLIKKFFWQRVQAELLDMPTCRSIIHGDFTSNNIKIDAEGLPHILDFERLRYGYQQEDICFLFLQLSGFRGLYGSLKRFRRLKEMYCQTAGDEERNAKLWLYGVQMFYLNMLRRRLCNTNKRRSLRKNICLLIGLAGYFRLSRLFKKN